MRHIFSFFISLLFMFCGLPFVGTVLELLIPNLGFKEFFFFIPRTIWVVFKEYQLASMLETHEIYLIIALILNCLGIYISKKTENRIYAIVILFVSIIGLASGSIV